jgi:hypothetical protein
MQSESRIQQEIVMWFKNNYCLKHHSPRSMIFHIPNQGQQRFISIGVYPGAADLFLHHKGKSIFVEVKEPQKGKQSENQEQFQEHCNQIGLIYEIVFSLEEFKELIKSL